MRISILASFVAAAALVAALPITTESNIKRQDGPWKRQLRPPTKTDGQAAENDVVKRQAWDMPIGGDDDQLPRDPKDPHSTA